MPRMLDLECPGCGREIYDKFFMEVPETIPCEYCGTPMRRLWSVRKNNGTQWHESESIVVFQKPDGAYSFPARNDKPTPQGWTRLVARSDREVAALESRTHTLNESRWFDRGTARGFDSTFRGRKYD